MKPASYYKIGIRTFKQFTNVVLIPIFVLIFFFSAVPADESTAPLTATRELKNKSVSSPDTFRAEYRLSNLPARPRIGARLGPGIAGQTQEAGLCAEVAVNVLAENFRPIRTYVLRNVTNVDNAITIWDGRDMYGREMPKGEYYAQLSIVYSDTKQETKCIRFEKK